MRRAVIVATGNLDSLPAEVQDVSNILSSAGWVVRLRIGADATRAGLARAVSEGPCDLAWFGCHAGADGFALGDGVLSAPDLGVWLAQMGATECVLNACHSLEHVTAIQRAADCGVACSIDPAGVSDALAWVTGVAIARAFVTGGDMAAAVAAATGNGITLYRYIPRGGRGTGRAGRMSNEDQELLRQLVNAIKGDGYTGLGLIRQWQQLSDSLASYVEEQDRWRTEQARINTAHDERLRNLEGNKPMAVTERSVYVSVIVVALLALALLGGVLLLNGAM